MRIKSGFTLLEVMIASLFLAVTLLSLISVVSFSNQGAMDAYYEFLAQSLCHEPMEIFRGMGYRYMSEYDKHPLSEYPLGWNPIVPVDNPDGDVWRPVDAVQYKRLIEVSSADSSGIRAVRVKVAVAPVGGKNLRLAETQPDQL